MEGLVKLTISRPSEIKQAIRNQTKGNTKPNHLAAAKELFCRNLRLLNCWIANVVRRHKGDIFTQL